MSLKKILLLILTQNVSRSSSKNGSTVEIYMAKEINLGFPCLAPDLPHFGDILVKVKREIKLSGMAPGTLACLNLHLCSPLPALQTSRSLGH